nr:M15 family metallopeptidase [Candidatus Saccharibacteria bacterium]
MSKKILVFVVIILIGSGIVGFLVTRDDMQKTTPTQAVSQSAPQTANKRPQGFDKNTFKLDEPGSPWWVVNKKRPLPTGYVPSDLAVPNVKLRLAPSAEQMQFSKLATPALEEMFAAAKSEGIELVFGSGYRSEALQKQFYDSYVAQDGQAAADRYSARPGTSEHQTGLVFDATASNGVCHLEICFETTPE